MHDGYHSALTEKLAGLLYSTMPRRVITGMTFEDRTLAKEAEMLFGEGYPEGHRALLRQRGHNLIKNEKIFRSGWKDMSPIKKIPAGLIDELSAAAQLAQTYLDTNNSEALSRLLSPVMYVTDPNGRRKMVVGNFYANLTAKYFSQSR